MGTIVMVTWKVLFVISIIYDHPDGGQDLKNPQLRLMIDTWSHETCTSLKSNPRTNLQYTNMALV